MDRLKLAIDEVKDHYSNIQIKKVKFCNSLSEMDDILFPFFLNYIDKEWKK